MKNGDEVEYDDREERNKPAIFIRKIGRGRHKGMCVVRIRRGGKERLVKIRCDRLRKK